MTMYYIGQLYNSLCHIGHHVMCIPVLFYQLLLAKNIIQDKLLTQLILLKLAFLIIIVVMIVVMIVVVVVIVLDYLMCIVLLLMALHYQWNFITKQLMMALYILI